MSGFGLFERVGVEIEYMIVDAETMAVLPIADRFLVDEKGEPQSDLVVGSLTWSNEIVLHVLELKTGEPAMSLHGLAAPFQDAIRQATTRLAPFGAFLLPSGMHPTMDPASETRLWPHDSGDIYAAFHRIFDCSGHGWANLQSVHINLPFRDTAEFRRLHAAIRVVLPLMPSLAASSPLMEGRVTRWLDTRLEMYRHNAARVPSVCALVVPEPVESESEYRDTILDRIYRDLEPLDPEGTLRDEWVNARGAIARFHRNTIEIRVLDTQECPLADLAVAAATTSAIRRMTDEETASIDTLNALSTERLAVVLENTITNGDRAIIEDRDYLECIGWTRGPASARDLWNAIIDRGIDDGADRPRFERALEHILSQGCLARRIIRTIGDDVSKNTVAAAYRRLAGCLTRGELLDSPPM
jgi:gamma-glutamyl:cysteine ligase YbdK (ATP-grasp superfamily)